MFKVTLIILTSVVTSAVSLVACEHKEQEVYKLIEDVSPRELYNAVIASQSPQDEQDIYLGSNPRVDTIFKDGTPGYPPDQMGDQKLFVVTKESGTQNGPSPWMEYVREVSHHVPITCSTKFKQLPGTNPLDNP